LTVSRRIVVTLEARDQLDALHTYISAAADTQIASRFVDGIIDHIATLRDFPKRWTPRDDRRRGLRTLAW
jgi:plasmid stabilization system protein ParE